MKSILFILITTAICITTGCAPQNLAQEKSPSESVKTNEKLDKNSEQENAVALKSSSSELLAAATPKPVVKKVSNEVCPDPIRPCHHRDREFAGWELPFPLPTKIVANKGYSSAEFYAVILKKYDNTCAEGLEYDEKIETERIKVQKQFPKNKVFAEYSCPNLDAVSYEFKEKLDAKGEYVLYTDYIAIYAGATEAEAQEILEGIRTDYPQAEIKKMKAHYELLEM